MSDAPREGPENVVIVGSGPAGYTAALYGARANLDPLVIEGFTWGGLLQETTDVENYPGFPERGITGPELMRRLREQARQFGARLVSAEATHLEFATEPGRIHTVRVGDRVHYARTVILATGAEHKRLGVRGERELAGTGVSYCATCDAAFFRDHIVMVIGGGDTALEEAMFLAKFASKVIVVHRRDQFRASKIMLERTRAIENVEFKTPYTVKEFGDGGGPFERVARVRNAASGEIEEIRIGGAFVAIGHEPQSKIVTGAIDTDDDGYVQVEGRSTRTSRPGVFAAGDLVDRTYRQAITAAGSGCQAALDAERYLRDVPQTPVEIEIPEPQPEGRCAGSTQAAEILVYTTDACPYCVGVKQLLHDRGLQYTEINLARDPEGRATLVAKTGMMTFPQLFVDGVLVGGCEETYAADRAGRLGELVGVR